MKKHKLNSMVSLPAKAKMSFAFLLFLLVITMTSVAQNNCRLTLSVENNMTIRTIKDAAFTYALFLENFGNSDLNLSLSAFCNNENCEDPNHLHMDNKALFASTLLDENHNTIKDGVRIKPGQKIKFYLKLEVPENTPFETWNCTIVVAEVLGCEPVSVELHTFNPDPLNLE